MIGVPFFFRPEAYLVLDHLRGTKQHLVRVRYQHVVLIACLYVYQPALEITTVGLLLASPQLRLPQPTVGALS